MKNIEMVYCGEILEDLFIEAKLKDYRDHRVAQKQNVGPYYKGYDIGAQRANNGYPNQDLSIGIESWNSRIEDIDVRFYRSRELHDDSPCIVYIHGGGFTAGSLDAVENPCKRLAQLSASCVISLDYGLAPEHPFPIAINQCKKVLDHLYEHSKDYRINKQAIALSGDSAGGNIALSVAQLDAQEKKCISYLMLYYPVVDLSDSSASQAALVNNETKHNSYIEACLSSLKGCEKQFRDCYLQGHNAEDNLVSPLYLTSLEDLPPMIFCLGEFDYLRSSQVAFYEKFKHEHEIEMICYAGVNHAFLDKLGIFPQADVSLHKMAEKWKQRIMEVL